MAADYSPPWVDALTPPPPGKKRPLARGLFFIVIVAVIALSWILSHKERAGIWLYDWAKKHYQAVIAAPDKASASQAKEAVGLLFLVERWAGGTETASKALEQIGAIAMAQGLYKEARQAYEPICARYNQNSDACLMSRIFVGRTYEAEGRWEEAAQVYAGMERYHPWSKLWHEAPLYPALMYTRIRQPEKAKSAYEAALKLFSHRIKDAKDDYAATTVTWQVVMAYEGLEDWQRAEQILRASIKDPVLRPEKRPQFMLELARALEKQMRISEAKFAYKQLLERFPDSSESEEVRKQVKWVYDEF